MEAMLGVNREQLGTYPRNAAGRLLDHCGDRPESRLGQLVRIDCAKLGTGAWSIPSRVEHLQFEGRKAKFILVIETASLFQRLVHHQYYEKADCILVSMSGVPPVPAGAS